MEDKIQINGVWYVREDSIKPTSDMENSIELPPVHTESLTYESKDYCFSVSRIYKDDDQSFYDGLDVEFTDKRSRNRSDWKTDHWDSDAWLLGVYNNEPESLKPANEMMCEHGIKELQFIIKQLLDRGWLTK